MNTKIIKILDFKVETIKKDIKNMHLGVFPPNGRIRVSAPLKTNDEIIKSFILSRVPWIKKQKAKFLNQDRQTKREYISGESHYIFGNRYLLNVLSNNLTPRIEVERKKINLYVNPKTDIKKREKIFDRFYREELKKQIPQLIEKWKKKIGINVEEVKIKKMKTKWGTCNTKRNRIWVNLELAKKPLRCLEYILVHEMIHFYEKNHTEKFKQLMNSFMPQWQQYKDELNKTILAYSVWNR